MMNLPVSTRPTSDENLDDTSSIFAIAKEAYPNYCRPYRHKHKAFSQHPAPLPRSFRGVTPLSSHHSGFLPSPTYNSRDTRQERLRRSMEGINRAIVEEITVLNKLLELGDPMAEERLEHLQSTLIPEWRQHLDIYMDEIDMLTWCQIEAGRQRPLGNLPSLGPYWQWREAGIEDMLLFAMLCLSETSLTLKRRSASLESMTPVLNVPTSESEDSEDSFTEIGYDGDESDGQWLEISNGDL